jgi:hypothetical protein
VRIPAHRNNLLRPRITENGVLPDPRKVAVIENFPGPTTVKQVKSFVGMASYYRKFISRFSKIAAPLHALLKKDVQFVWTPDLENAFQALKGKLISKPILQYPDYSKEFILTDRGDSVTGNNRKGFTNRLYYSTSEKELLAIAWGVKHFRPYLYGRTFKISSDHKPLT